MEDGRQHEKEHALADAIREVQGRDGRPTDDDLRVARQLIHALDRRGHCLMEVWDGTD